MFLKIRKHLLSFDFYRSAVLSIIVVATIFYAIKNNIYTEAFPFVLGILFGFFANIEGTNKHRIVGIIISIFWSIICLCICLFSSFLPQFFHLLTVCFFIFTSSMLSVYGYRGSMISFSGLFAVVMSLILQDGGLAYGHILINCLFGGLVYLLFATITHLIYQSRNIKIVLAECLDLTANYISTIEDLRWEDSPALQNELLKTQNLINEKHELLRTLLMSSRNKLMTSNKHRKQYLLFIEIVNIFENALAKNVNTSFLNDKLNGEDEISDTIRKVSKLVVLDLNRFATSLRFNKDFRVSADIEKSLSETELQIQKYIAKVGPKNAREVTLTARNLVDLEYSEFQKLITMQRINENIFNTEQLNIQKSKSFLTPNDYSPKVIWANLNLKSNIFRHSLRITTAVIAGYVLGKYIADPQVNWIIVTIVIILRPNYGLTKARAQNRIIGTFLGAIISFIIMAVSSNHAFYGVVASITMLFGFSFLLKDYRLSSTLISISIILLYVINDHDGYETIIKRLEFTSIGVLISFISMYLLWPVWENYKIVEVLENAIEANKKYWEAVVKKYKYKSEIDTHYKLLRKGAFLMNSNLNSSFQRMSDEPISKRKNLSNLYAAVLLNQTFLSAVAALSSYIQGHKTTEMSDAVEIITNRISQNLKFTLLKLHNPQAEIQEISTKNAFVVIQNKYQELNEIRNQEILSGKMVMATEMREKLQESKIVIEQLKWLKSISDNMKNIGEMIH